MISSIKVIFTPSRLLQQRLVFRVVGQKDLRVAPPGHQVRGDLDDGVKVLDPFSFGTASKHGHTSFLFADVCFSCAVSFGIFGMNDSGIKKKKTHRNTAEKHRYYIPNGLLRQISRC